MHLHIRLHLPLRVSPVAVYDHEIQQDKYEHYQYDDTALDAVPSIQEIWGIRA